MRTDLAEWVQSAVHATNTETEDGLVRAEEADASCKKAPELLDSHADAYQAALDALRQDLREELGVGGRARPEEAKVRAERVHPRRQGPTESSSRATSRAGPRS